MFKIKISKNGEDHSTFAALKLNKTLNSYNFLLTKSMYMYINMNK